MKIQEWTWRKWKVTKKAKNQLFVIRTAGYVLSIGFFFFTGTIQNINSLDCLLNKCANFFSFFSDNFSLFWPHVFKKTQENYFHIRMIKNSKIIFSVFRVQSDVTNGIRQKMEYSIRISSGVVVITALQNLFF